MSDDKAQDGFGPHRMEERRLKHLLDKLEELFTPSMEMNGLTKERILESVKTDMHERGVGEPRTLRAMLGVSNISVDAMIDWAEIHFILETLESHTHQTNATTISPNGAMYGATQLSGMLSVALPSASRVLEESGLAGFSAEDKIDGQEANQIAKYLMGKSQAAAQAGGGKRRLVEAASVAPTMTRPHSSDFNPNLARERKVQHTLDALQRVFAPFAAVHRLQLQWIENHISEAIATGDESPGEVHRAMAHAPADVRGAIWSWGSIRYGLQQLEVGTEALYKPAAAATRRFDWNDARGAIERGQGLLRNHLARTSRELAARGLMDEADVIVPDEVGPITDHFLDKLRVAAQTGGEVKSLVAAASVVLDGKPRTLGPDAPEEKKLNMVLTKARERMEMTLNAQNPKIPFEEALVFIRHFHKDVPPMGGVYDRISALMDTNKPFSALLTDYGRVDMAMTRLKHAAPQVAALVNGPPYLSADEALERTDSAKQSFSHHISTLSANLQKLGLMEASDRIGLREAVQMADYLEAKATQHESALRR